MDIASLNCAFTRSKSFRGPATTRTEASRQMPSELLLFLGLIPSMLVVFVVLTTYYGTNRAYLAISFVPIAYLVIIWMFRAMLDFQNVSDQWWLDLAATIAWASLVQAALGVILIVRSLYRRKGTVSLVLATTISAAPFLLGLIQ